MAHRSALVLTSKGLASPALLSTRSADVGERGRGSSANATEGRSFKISGAAQTCCYSTDMPTLLLAVLLAMTIGPAVQAQPPSRLEAGRQADLQEDDAARDGLRDVINQRQMHKEVIAPIPASPMETSLEEQANREINESPRESILNGSCRVEWRSCKDNLQMVNTYSHWRRVRVECRSAATQLMRYGEPNFPWFAFRSFLQGDDYPRAGIVTVIEPRAQFRNGLGAVVSGRVVCRYDLRIGQVLDVQIL